VASLQKFLENPLFHRVRKGLSADPDQDDLAEQSDAALESDALETATRCRNLLGRFLSDPALVPEIAVRELLSLRAWESRAPEAGFLECEARNLVDWTSKVFPALGAMLPRPGEGLVQRDLASLSSAWISCVDFGDGVNIRLDGQVGLGWRGDAAEPSLTLVDLVPFSGKKPDPHRKARLYLAGAVLRTAGAADAIHLVWVERMGDGQLFREDLPVAANPDWMLDLARDSMDPQCAQFLPLRECLAKGPLRASILDALEEPRRRRDLLEELLVPELPDLAEDAFSALLSRRFRPWMEAR
jgi:hypothetical protein